MATIHDRRLLGLLALVMLAHFISFWSKISQSVSEIALSKSREEAPQIKLIPMNDQQWAQFKTKTKSQIVQNDDSGRQEKPKDEAFLGEKDMTYDRQTVARRIDTFNKAGKGETHSKTRAQDKVTAQAETLPQKKALKDLKLSDLGMPAEVAPVVQPRQPASIAKQGQRHGDEKSTGVSSTNDYIENARLGDFTQLNTVEYKYYGFFHRIRGKLEQFWGRSLKEKADSIYKSGRSIASSDQYSTALVITMNEQGEITSVKVKSSSGVKELDDAAVESFNQAGPFPNPPKGLLVNGQATIEWGFVVVNS